jgi:hypothetical protein
VDTGPHRNCTAVERTNSWLNHFRVLLEGFEKSVENWLAFYFLAFVVLLLRKMPSEPKSSPEHFPI